MDDALRAVSDGRVRHTANDRRMRKIAATTAATVFSVGLAFAVKTGLSIIAPGAPLITEIVSTLVADNCKNACIKTALKQPARVATMAPPVVTLKANLG